MQAYRDHGQPAARLVEGLDQAHESLEQLKQIGIDLDATTQQLEDEGVEKFNRAYDHLLVVLEQKREQALKLPQMC